ncbi:hypothetical protein [Spirochaeta africana]|uniref:Tetratricopeptide repeat protein n=1 Tax=Spirochaeta africana (strain ATCC 700263 / DSM 8902 / Z-7692) TaxID=889378 RepID=H9UK31_SPIAZ|nr:hypothetical protein [Spirochaeta africana]AFG37874.1 hypothetical protein Spiaf_1817 [Spirochaeta africana DSM 8902]
MQRNVIAGAVLTVLLLVLYGCSNLLGGPVQQESAAELRQLLAERSDDPDAQVVVVEQLIQQLRKDDRHQEIQPLLSRLVARQPDNPYNAYYLTLIGEQLRSDGKPHAARLYYYRAVYRYPDVEIGSNSVHYRALNALLATTSDPERKLQHYTTLQSRFAGRIDPGLHHYHMARTYESIGDYEAAFEEYRKFISYPDTRIPGKPNAHRSVQQLLDFQNSSRNWTHETLDGLVREIQAAIAARNPARLNRSRSQANFFAMSWKQDESDANTQPNIDIGSFLIRNRIRYASELEPQSNSHEAFLWTSGWEARIPTWYLYFRKIDFPADPEIHGNWEWAGIYFGESL